MSAGIIAAHYAASGGGGSPTVNGTAVYIPDGSEFVAWPAGTVAGDLIIAQVVNGWAVQVPAGWTTDYLERAPGNGDGMLVSKVMNSIDIAAGGVTMTATGGNFPGNCNIVRVPGLNTESLANSSPTGLLTIATDPSSTEQIVTGCDLDLTTPGAQVSIVYNLWWSMSDPGNLKTVTWRIRRDDLSGAILASGSNSATIDSTAGHNMNPNGQVVDAAPTTGRYVLTVQATGVSTAAIHSDSRTFTLLGNPPFIRSFTGVYAGTGFTSLAVGPSGTAQVGDTALYMVGHRVSSITQNCDIGTLVSRQAGTNASGGFWQEAIASSGTRTATFTSASAGSNNIAQVVLVAAP